MMYYKKNSLERGLNKNKKIFFIFLGIVLFNTSCGDKNSNPPTTPPTPSADTILRTMAEAEKTKAVEEAKKKATKEAAIKAAMAALGGVPEHYTAENFMQKLGEFVAPLDDRLQTANEAYKRFLFDNPDDVKVEENEKFESKLNSKLPQGRLGAAIVQGLTKLKKEGNYFGKSHEFEAYNPKHLAQDTAFILAALKLVKSLDTLFKGEYAQANFEVIVNDFVQELQKFYNSDPFYNKNNKIFELGKDKHGKPIEAKEDIEDDTKLSRDSMIEEAIDAECTYCRVMGITQQNKRKLQDLLKETPKG